MKILTTNGLTKLIQLIKGAFIKKEDVVAASTLDIDTTPTANSTNLITSGAVAGYHDSSKQDKLTDANAGDNVTITEEGGVIKISSTGGGSTDDCVHKTGNETVPGVKTFNGGKIATGAQPSIIATNGFYAGGYNITGWADISCHRLCDSKINTGSYYINSDGSVIFRHKTGTSSAEGSSNDAILTIHPVNGIKAGFAGTAGGTATQNDVLIDTVNYNKLTTSAKDVLGAINELNDKPSGASVTFKDWRVS